MNGPQNSVEKLRIPRCGSIAHLYESISVGDTIVLAAASSQDLGYLQELEKITLHYNSLPNVSDLVKQVENFHSFKKPIMEVYERINKIITEGLTKPLHIEDLSPFWLVHYQSLHSWVSNQELKRYHYVILALRLQPPNSTTNKRLPVYKTANGPLPLKDDPQKYEVGYVQWRPFDKLGLEKLEELETILKSPETKMKTVQQIYDHLKSKNMIGKH